MNLRVEEIEAYEYDQSKARLVSEIIRYGLVSTMLQGKGEELVRFIETMVAEDLNSVRLYAPDGSIIASSENNRKIGLREDELRGTRGPEMLVSKEGSSPVYSMWLPFFNETACQNCHGGDGNLLCVLNVSLSMNKSFTIVRHLREGAVLNFALVVLIVSISIGFATSYLVNRPLKRILATIKRAEQGDVKARVEMKREDLIGELGRRLDSMLSAIENQKNEMGEPGREWDERTGDIGELASAIAHEIKNPLAGISGAIQVFAEEFPADDRRREIITEVLSEIERLDRTVRNLLSFARPPEPNLVLMPTETLIEKTISLIEERINKQGANVGIMGDGEHSVVRMDPEQMQQALMNIMLNSLQSMPAGGTIKVSTHVMKESNKFEITVSDTGSGISTEDIEKIFTPFYTTRNTGTGLGLAISRDIVERHKGSIIVESKVGVGSSFRITLPLEDTNV